MPQMDSATYFGQVTWFAVVFAVFYLVVLTDVLPGLNRALKVRTKKIERVRGDARQFDGVRVSAQDALDTHVGGVSRMISRITGERIALAQNYGRALLALRFVMRKRTSAAGGEGVDSRKAAVAGRIAPLTAAKAAAKAAIKASAAKVTRKAGSSKSVKAGKGDKVNAKRGAARK